MDTGYKVYDCMTTKPVSISPDATLQECAKAMDENHVGALLIKKDQQSLGVITEQDLVRKVLSVGINPLDRKVSDFMEHKLVTISSRDDLYDAITKMRDYNIRHLPVVDNDKLIGLLTLKDILKIEPQLFDLMVEKFEVREESRKPISINIPTEGICNGCGEYSEKIKRIKNSIFCRECAEEQA